VTGLEIISHDGPARLGRFAFGEASFATPAGCFFRESHNGFRRFELGSGSPVGLVVPPPPGLAGPGDGRPPDWALEDGMVARHILADGEEEAANPDCVILRMREEGSLPDIETGLVVLESGEGAQPDQIMKDLILARRSLSPNAAILIPDADVWSFPLHALAGADMFGDSHARAGGFSGEMIFESFSVNVSTRGPADCQCPVCASSAGAGDGDAILAHNRWVTRRVLGEIRTRTALGQLKHLAEERCLAHPPLSACLKRLYRDHFSYLEEHTTISPGVER
jgi:predicted RNA-binding protein